jgi:hypothetical protein
MPASGRQFGDDTRLFMNGRWLSGTERRDDNEKVAITHDTLSRDGIHLLDLKQIGTDRP